MKQVLSGQSSLRCGQFVPKQKAEHPKTPEDLFDIPGTAALLLPDPSPWLDRTLYSYISDGWTWVCIWPAESAGKEKTSGSVPAGAERSDRSILGACTESGSSCPS